MVWYMGVSLVHGLRVNEPDWIIDPTGGSDRTAHKGGKPAVSTTSG